MPCPSAGRSSRHPPPVTTSPTAANCSTRDSKRRRWWRSSRRRREARARRSSTDWGASLLKTGQTAKARAAYERALCPAARPVRGQQRPRHAPGGERRPPGAAIDRFGRPRGHASSTPTPLNNLGYAFLLTGPTAHEAQDLYERALKLQPDLPEALNNLGLILGQGGDLGARGAPTPEGPAEAPRLRRGREQPGARPRRPRPGRGGDPPLLREFLERNPAAENTYIALAKIYLAGDRRREGLETIDRLLQRNLPSTPRLLVPQAAIPIGSPDATASASWRTCPGCRRTPAP